MAKVKTRQTKKAMATAAKKRRVKNQKAVQKGKGKRTRQVTNRRVNKFENPTGTFRAVKRGDKTEAYAERPTKMDPETTAPTTDEGQMELPLSEIQDAAEGTDAAHQAAEAALGNEPNETTNEGGLNG